MTIWRMSFANCIPEATNTYSAYVILIVFHCNSGYANAPQCNIIRTLPLLSSVFTAKNRILFCKIKITVLIKQ